MTDPAITIALVQKAQSGDRASLERVLDRYYDRVRRTVSIRMGPRVRSWTDSVDIMTRTFMKALEKFDAFEMHNESSLLRWLVTIAEGMIHDAADERNAARRNPDRERPIEVGGADATAARMPLPAPATSLIKELGRREDMELVDRAIEALEPGDRETLLQHYYLEMSWEEIAQQQGSCEATDDKAQRDRAADVVRKRAALARSRLAIQLQKMRGGRGSGAAASGSS
jgi:RNA polymerase sigma factor (sigma-70 family)